MVLDVVRQKSGFVVVVKIKFEIEMISKQGAGHWG